MTVFLQALTKGTYERIGEVNAEAVPRKGEGMVVDDVPYYVHSVDWRVVPSREMGRKLTAWVSLERWRG
jgi:hypothetical protein